MPIVFEKLNEGNEVVWAKGRHPDRVYAYRSFVARWGRDAGHPSRYVYKVFDEKKDLDEPEEWDWTGYVVSTTPGGRKQLRLARIVHETRV
ncbi:hypothetical protein [Mobilicoccus caccae]|uniref:Uncharacterized protein n=1 Tax=Mobilicoccus caccae TaxID=1859295 RepID=A0ABQ6IUZ9_9MICO|nr:hypothetical protein [Mobilicoccus caccae]GMA41768.1 hypothetical protein GCM10025883_38130 [Mobilicoccus caccae]